MIYTCTLNPALDYYVEVDPLNLGKLNISKNSQLHIGGKGINVSIVMNHLGLKSIPIGFVGGLTGDYLKQQLTDVYQLSHQFVEIEESTRINIKIINEGTETEINPPGPNIKPKEMHQLQNIIDKIEPNDILVCSGSLPKGIPNAYRDIAHICKEKDVSFVMDTSGAFFDEFLEYKPLLIKPNLEELCTYYKKNIENIDDIIDSGKRLVIKGAQHVMISLGKNGSLLITKDKVFQALPIKGDVVSSVGSGDSMVAGFIKTYIEEKDIKLAYQYAVAAATATAFKNGLANKEDIEYQLKYVKIKEITK